MKGALILLCGLAFVSCSRRYPGGGSHLGGSHLGGSHLGGSHLGGSHQGGGGRYPGGGVGGGAPIIFPDEVHGQVRPHPKPHPKPHPQPLPLPQPQPQPFPQPFPQPGPPAPGSFPSAVGHGGERLNRDACRQLGSSLIHDTVGESSYHFSWCADGGQRYTWDGAVNYCRSLGRGWAPVSIESQSEDNYIVNIVGRHRSPWIWTSGNRRDDDQFDFTWLGGRPLTYSNWGLTGSLNVRQPDNAENNNERCLSLLNQFYRGDFITWHDIGCHHEKPTICELNDSLGPVPSQYGK